MKKKIAAAIIIVCIIAALMPTTSHAAVTPFFMGVNDTLLPFSNDTMPYVVGGEIFVPHGIFSGVDVHSVASEALERVRIYRGASRHIDFFTGRGVTEDQDGNTLQWPSARRVGSRFYVPLRQVCEFFELTYEILDIGRDIIAQEQMRVIRIRPREGFTGYNGPTFVGSNRNAIRAAYNEYYGISLSPSPPATSPMETTPSPPVVELPPSYNDVTIYHSFYNISAGGTEVILELLEASASPDYRFCFFVSADDIKENAGLIRRISGSGHAIGIWLTKGTYNEYYETSALLFEAAKIKTVIVSANSNIEQLFTRADDHGIVFWKMSRSFVYDDTYSVDEVTDMIPQHSGSRQNLFSSCSENMALMLSGILSFLSENEYSVVRITETVTPV